MPQNATEQAAKVIADADALFIGAGAGMGVDSGLPDFRGREGFWRAYPPLEELGLDFAQMANPTWFVRDPQLAWGFYGHRLELYKKTTPHRGFDVLRRLGEATEHGVFVFTSNVDGHFQSADFDADRIVECHGSIHHLQCAEPCSDDIWSSADTSVDVDEATFRAAKPLPRCPKCNTVARPNILMFGDARWIERRTQAQHDRFGRWMSRIGDARVVVIESGAGTAVPTVRWQCERLADALDAPLVRINPREAQGPSNTIPVARSALAALEAIEERIWGA